MFIDPEKFRPKKPQCVHKTDADNCLLCGTKVVKEWKPVAGACGNNNQHLTPIFRFWCKTHDCVEPCFQCDVAFVWGSEAKDNAEKSRLIEIARINEISNRIWVEDDARRAKEAWPEGGKCAHGHYMPEYYCNVCAIATVEPDYDREKYRTAIRRALKNARRTFGEAPEVKKLNTPTNMGMDDAELPSRYKTEREKHFEDLLSLVDLRIWQASHKYGSEMNDALAYTIAKNTAGAFVRDVIEDTTMLEDIAWKFMPPSLLQQAQELFQRCEENLDALWSLSMSGRAPKEDRALAKKIISEYGERGPRFESMDIPTRLAEKKGPDGDSTSRAEYEYWQQQNRPEKQEHQPDYRADALHALVATWFGTKRKVAEAMLTDPDFTVRDVPGVPKSTVGRLQRIVKEEFMAHLGKVVAGGTK